jgi:hypothetical protein
MHSARCNQPLTNGTITCLPQRQPVQRPTAGATTDEPWSPVNSGNQKQRSQNLQQQIHTINKTIPTVNTASLPTLSTPLQSSVSSPRSNSLSPSSATRSTRTDRSATNRSRSKRRCCSNRNNESQLEVEDEYLSEPESEETRDDGEYRCPVWQKAKEAGRLKLSPICQTIKGTKGLIE